MMNKRLARHYAEALFAAAQKWGQEEELGEKLAYLNQMVEEDAELKRILSNPLLSPQEQETALKALLPRFLSRKKEELISAIAPEYQRLLDEAGGIERVEVMTAVPLSTDLESKLEERLVRLIGKKVRLEIKIKPQILGGLILRWGDRIIDASVKKKLELIGSRLKTV
ncbi:MAG: ATP synthase F1 subunit delta [Firmicutes bacterium]|nr:ATP synthase F1 subunit delta [Bacillota bacterium]